MSMQTKLLRVFAGGVLAWMLVPAAFAQKDNALTPKEKKEGWVLLFDGTSTNGWKTAGGKPVPAGWEIKNGTLSTKKDAKGGDIVSDGEFSDFDLKADFNIAPEGNSGLKYFFTKYEQGGNLGFEYQILDDKLAEDNKKANHLTGSFYDVMQPDESKKKVNAPGQWNTLRIVAKGKNVQHYLNGVKILEFSRGGKVYTDAVALSKFNKAVPAFGSVEKGHILLQEHGAEVSFKNIKIKAL
jgi:hypothetical protein